MTLYVPSVGLFVAVECAVPKSLSLTRVFFCSPLLGAWQWRLWLKGRGDKISNRINTSIIFAATELRMGGAITFRGTMCGGRG